MNLSLEQKEHLFHELSALLRSGHTLGESFQSLAKGKGRIGSFAAGISKPETIDDLLEQTKSVFSPLDEAALRAGARSAKLVEVTAQLSSYYAMLAKARSRVRRHLAYPIFILHFAALILSVPYLFYDDGIAGFLRAVVATLLAFYVAGALLAAFWFGSIALARRSSAFEAGMIRFPLLGKLWLEMCGGRFAMTLSFAVGSGIGVLSALPEAGMVSGSAGLREWSDRATRRIRGGESLSDAFADCPFLPEEVDRALRSGETSGRIDTELERAATRLVERSDQRLESLSTWFPRLTYVAILVVVLLRVASLAQHLEGIYDSLLYI